MNTTSAVIWKCEQYVAGKLHEKTMFGSEVEAREFCAEIVRGQAGYNPAD